MRAIPGLFVIFVGVVVLVLRQAFVAGSDTARSVWQRRPTSQSQEGLDHVLVVVLGVGLVVLGIVLAVGALVSGGR